MSAANPAADGGGETGEEGAAQAGLDLAPFDHIEDPALAKAIRSIAARECRAAQERPTCEKRRGRAKERKQLFAILTYVVCLWRVCILILVQELRRHKAPPRYLARKQNGRRKPAARKTK